MSLDSTTHRGEMCGHVWILYMHACLDPRVIAHTHMPWCVTAGSYVQINEAS